jgi:hypothetical protein
MKVTLLRMLPSLMRNTEVSVPLSTQGVLYMVLGKYCNQARYWCWRYLRDHHQSKAVETFDYDFIIPA